LAKKRAKKKSNKKETWEPQTEVSRGKCHLGNQEKKRGGPRESARLSKKLETSEERYRQKDARRVAGTTEQTGKKKRRGSKKPGCKEAEQWDKESGRSKKSEPTGEKEASTVGPGKTREAR